MESIPCKNCITLAICKARIINHIKINTDINIKTEHPFTCGPFYIYYNLLSPKCSIIKDWMDKKSIYSKMLIIDKMFLDYKDINNDSNTM